jgi:hypothetical protein
MPMLGFPNVLEVFFNEAIHEYGITSWNIRSREHFTEIVMRFNMSSVPGANLKYRKVPPSRLARDRVRAASGSRETRQVDIQMQTESEQAEWKQPNCDYCESA